MFLLGPVFNPLGDKPPDLKRHVDEISIGVYGCRCRCFYYLDGDVGWVFFAGYELMNADFLAENRKRQIAEELRKRPAFRYCDIVHVVIAGLMLAFMLAAFFLITAFAVNTAKAYAMSGAELDALVPIIVQAESSGDPKTVGKGGERGLMQISHTTWRLYSALPWSDAFIPEKNVQVGREILEDINNWYKPDGLDDAKHICYTYNCGLHLYGPMPWKAKHHPNKIYRAIFNEK